MLNTNSYHRGPRHRNLIRQSIIGSFDVEKMLEKLSSIGFNQQSLELAGLGSRAADILCSGMKPKIDLIDIVALCLHFRISIDSLVEVWDSEGNPPQSSSLVIVEYTDDFGDKLNALCTFANGKFMCELPKEKKNKPNFVEIKNVSRWKYVNAK